MKTSLYTATIPVLKKNLLTLSALLDKGGAFASEKEMGEADLLGKNLAADMFTLTKQVQAACDNAKFLPFRLTDTTPPVFEDTETTIVELKERIAKTVALLDAVKQEDIDGKEDAQVKLKFFEGKHLTGFGYAFEFLMPNFFFHLITAYGILRAHGVQIGKSDFLGGLPLLDDAS